MQPVIEPLHVVVQGLWHLGCVTAACCARHFHVVGLDEDESVIGKLRQGEAPLFEPGLNERLAEGLKSGRLSFSNDPAVCRGADVLWVCYDTPVNANDEPDTAHVLERVRRAIPYLPKSALVVISAQLPVGTCRLLEAEFSGLRVACSPENLRLGKAIESFEGAERAVIGIRRELDRPVMERLLQPFARQRMFMRVESAEMVKHALNGFLALSITYINEIARLCEHTGADAQEVAAGLKSEPRIGPRAYLGPGGPFAGGTLARDVVTLMRLGAAHHEDLAVVSAIKRSNDRHRQWAFERLRARLGSLSGCRVAVLGLVYTPNTDTLRRSAAVELCRQLVEAGAKVSAFDPAIGTQPEELGGVEVARCLEDALRESDAAVVCTEWPVFREADWPTLVRWMRQRVIVDANRFLEPFLTCLPGVEVLAVGRPSGLTGQTTLSTSAA